MEAYYEILSQCPLFAGITRQEMPEILNCLDKKVVEIPKGDPVFLEGEPARFVGVVLSGGVQIVRDDYYGRRSVLTVVSPGELFAQWAAEVTAMGGAVSAEHGVGKIKAGFWETMYGHEAMVESARLKLQLDPAGQLGRGNLFSEKLLDELVQKGGA